MSMNSIDSHARACRGREYLTRWFPTNIKLDSEPYPFGETELAVIEETLRCLEQGRSLLIHDPIPSNRILTGLSIAYIRTQDPRFPERGIVGGGKSLLAFPALHEGYVSEIDDFREDGIGRCPRLIDREPIDRLRQIQHSADMHTAKNNFEFDWDRPGNAVGMVFVDLRKPEWGNVARRFDAIMTLYEASDCPFVFYTDEMMPATEALKEQMNILSISNELLTTAEPTSLPENPSLTAQFEHLINTKETTVEQVVVGDPEMYSIVTDLSAMRDDIQASHDVQGVIKMEVGWLFNLLTRLPVKPEYWDAVVAENYYQQGVRELLENLRGKAQRLEGRAGSVLINYCEAANALHGRLNTKHLVQVQLLRLITVEANEGLGRPRIIVVKNDFERKAILRALTLEDRQLADTVSIRTVDDIEPVPGGEIIVARPLNADSYLYDFPTGGRVAFLHFEPWAPLVEDRLEQGMGQINVPIETQEIGQTGGRKKQQTESREAAGEYDPRAKDDEAAPTEPLRGDFEGPEQTGSSGTGGGGTASQDPDLEAELSNGETKRLSEQARVSILKDNGDIGRKQAADLVIGDTLLLLDAVADDVYDLFVESAHQKDKLQKAESIVDRWRTILNEGLHGDWSGEELLAAIQEHGSDITDQSSVSNWHTGEAIGPQDPEDVRRVLAVLEPEMEPMYEAAAEAMKRIRTEHRNIGRRARRAIESQMSGSISSNLQTELPGNVDQLSQDIRKASVESIDTLNTE